MKKRGQPKKKPAHNNSRCNRTTYNSHSAQRARLLDYLKQVKKYGCTTFDAREGLDIMSPAARVYELRWNFGFNIFTVWSTATNAQGNRHQVARYVLMRGKWRGSV